GRGEGECEGAMLKLCQQQNACFSSGTRSIACAMVARMDLGIRGRTAMVAAASKGLGRAIAGALVKEGARVSICARSAETLAAVEKELGVLAVPVDVTRPEDLSRWHDTTVERLAAPALLA